MNPEQAEIVKVEADETASENEVPSIYSNAVGFVATPFDLRFVFGQIKPKGGKLINEPLMSVIMSWEHSKALLVFLQKSIEEHERDFGPLRYSKKDMDHS